MRFIVWRVGAHGCYPSGPPFSKPLHLSLSSFIFEGDLWEVAMVTPLFAFCPHLLAHCLLCCQLAPTVLLKCKLPPFCETRLVSRETRLVSRETHLERNEMCLVSHECTGSTNTSHSSVFETRIKTSVLYRFNSRGRHSHQLCMCTICVL